MKYVLDSCVGFKTLLVEDDSDKAQRLCDDYQRNILELVSPDVVTSDDKLVRSLRPKFPFILPLTSVP